MQKCCVTISLLLVSALVAPIAIAQELNVVPWPINGKVTGGEQTFDDTTRIVIQNPSLLPLGKVFADEFLTVTGFHLPVIQTPPRDGDVVLDIDPHLQQENYLLSIGDRSLIQGANYNAVEMGTVTLLQLLKTDNGHVTSPRVEIHDGPKLEFNGYMLNVGLYPYSIDTLKRYVVYCQFNKIRYFQLDLSGDNGWVFPCKAFPKLGTTNWGWAGAAVPKVYDLGELKDLVAFADVRGVTLVPSFQTLSHSDAMRLAMPDTFDLPDKPGGPAHMAVVNIANPDVVYPAMNEILDEMCDVFKSSPYFHIGCDEANMNVLAAQPKVQQYLREHNLPTIWHLVTQHIARMNELVKKHGKRTIVWEPQVDFGDLPPDIIAMPWIGGSSIAEQYVKRGIHLISAPWGTETPYQDVYTVNAAHLKPGEPLLLGGMALNWASNFDDPVGASIFNEPIYNPDAHRGQLDFLRRAVVVNPTCDKMIYGFAFNLSGELPATTFFNTNPIFAQQLTLTLDCPKGGKVRYTTDGGAVGPDSQAYTAPIVLNDSTTIRAEWFSDDGSASGPDFSRFYQKQPMIHHDAIGAKVTLDPPKPGYLNGGAKALTDGFIAAKESCADPSFLGWQASPTITVDLQKPTQARSIYIHFLGAQGAIKLPKTLDLQTSQDGVKFDSVAKFTEDDGIKTRGWFGLKFSTPQTIEAIRAIAQRSDEWVFTDELIVNADPPGPSFPHAALGKPITVVNLPDNADPRTGELKTPPLQALTDGYVSDSPDWNNPEWLTFKKDIDATIDLGSPTDIHEVGATFMQHVWAGIHIPPAMNVLVSDDGKTFTSVATIQHDATTTPAEIVTLSTKLQNVRGRYVRIVVPVVKKVTVDEVFVNPRGG